jgi:ubiquinone/menaquinone biosynthesis C-methylase UbiE
MKHGDFTSLAKQYINRPGYSLRVLKHLAAGISDKARELILADVGAGTGKLTENLVELGLKGYAVEPSDAMRQEAINSGTTLHSFQWLKGCAENTGLGKASVDWVLMGSSFHWTDKKAALSEFHRILKNGGFFTACWNPRDIDKNELHREIEGIIYRYIPDLKRVSSGASQNMGGVEEDLLSTGQFTNLIFMEAPHEEVMSKERYIGAWRSVNDIQVQAGPEKFERILHDIENLLKNTDSITVPYKTRAWTVQAK